MELRDLTGAARSVAFTAGALGDFVLTWPLLRGLMAHGKLDVIARPSHAALVRYAMPGCVTHSVDSPEATALFGGPDAQPAAPGGRRGAAAVQSQTSLHAALAGADVVVSWLSGGDDPWAQAVRQAAPRARLVCLDARPPEGRAVHVQAWRREQLRRQGLTLPECDPPPASRSHPVDSATCDSVSICLHPGSGGRAKCWPLDRLTTTISILLDTGFAVRVVLGEVERERFAASDVSLLERTGAELTWLDDLVSLAQAIARSNVFVGNDAGPTHLAAQLGAPTVALFGPTDPRVWAPIGPDVTVLAPPTLSPMTWLDPGRVVEVVRRLAPPA